MDKPRGPRKIGDLIGRVMAKYGATQSTAQLERERAWKQVADERIRAHTRVGSMRRGTLEILVDSAPLLMELQGFRREELLAKLKQQVEHCEIKALRFTRV